MNSNSFVWELKKKKKNYLYLTFKHYDTKPKIKKSIARMVRLAYGK